VLFIYVAYNDGGTIHVVTAAWCVL
jgi:hypothetical protein